MAKQNGVKVLGADFSVGRLENDDGEFQTCLIVGTQVAFFIADDGARDFYNNLGDCLSDNVIVMPSGAELVGLPKMDIPKGA